jgi:hypothetical protein
MNHAKTSKILTVFVTVILCFGPVGLADPLSTAFTYQGRLIDSNQAANGQYDFKFKLFDANTAGNEVASDVNTPGTDVVDGYFTVMLDFGSVFDGNALWLEIGIRPSDQNDLCVYSVLSPRQKLTSAPYALYAASSPGGPGSSGVPVPLILSGSVASPAAVIDATNIGSGYGVMGKHNDTGNFGFLGSDSYGVFGSSSIDNGNGVGGSSSNSSGTGVYGYNSSSGYGVFGYSASGTAVYGSSNGNYGFLGSGSYGVYGNGNSGNIGVYGTSDGGIAVYGTSTNNSAVYGTSISSFGVYGRNDNSGNFGYLGSSGYGVYGNGNSDNIGVEGTSGNNVGVEGTSTYGYGVYGESTSGNGVYGHNVTNGNVGYLGTSGNGVYGYNTPSGNYGYLGSTSYGVYGQGHNSNTYGVYGKNDAVIGGTYGYLGGSFYGVYGYSGVIGFGYAGYFEGNVYVTGVMSAGTVIDRTPYPKDLATAYQAVMSMEKLPDGQYQENNKEKQLDHSKLSDFIRSKDGSRDLSATVSCQNEVIKDLIKQNKELKERLDVLEKSHSRKAN